MTLNLMRDPVATIDGHSFEREPTEKWLLDHSTNPLTGAPLSSKVIFYFRHLSDSLLLHSLIKHSFLTRVPESYPEHHFAQGH